MKYIVTEIQLFDTGAMSTPCYAYDDRNAAESKYHSILAVAATSKLPTHAAVQMTSDGQPIEHKYWHHTQETEQTGE